MIFIGFGFLVTSFHKFRLTTLANFFWIAALSVQLYFLFQEFWKGLLSGRFLNKIIIDTRQLIRAEQNATAILIASCAIIGKTNSLQFLIITVFGVALYSLTEVIIILQVKTRDLGGSITLQLFGSAYGLAIASAQRYRNSWHNLNAYETQGSLTTAFLGSLFLWCFWPSSNSALANSIVEIHLAMLNTYFSMIGSCIMAFTTSLFLGDGRFKMSQILNASLAGAVFMGSCGDYLYDGWIAYLGGGFIGVVSCFLFEYMPKYFELLGIQQAAGVISHHGIPSIMAGIFSAFIREIYLDDKGWLQIAGVGISLGMGVVGGLFIGEATRGLRYYQFKNDYYNDRTNVILPDFEEARLEIYGPPHSAEESVMMISNAPKQYELVTPLVNVTQPQHFMQGAKPVVHLQSQYQQSVPVIHQYPNAQRYSTQTNLHRELFYDNQKGMRIFDVLQ